MAGTKQEMEVSPAPAKEIDLNNSASIPAGLQALFTACRSLYPDQPNPLQITALVKYWLGGPDPLDYISMYEVPADPKLNIPAHWHYITFGLSDIHGDGRVHPRSSPAQPSGFGFELTLRLRRGAEPQPPTWPASVLQGLARYVFLANAVLQEGDHVALNTPLDGQGSRLRHVLLTEDATLRPLPTPNGRVRFMQVVGVTGEEMRAAQHWTCRGVLALMRRYAACGGPWLLTDVMRKGSIYEQDERVADLVETGIETEGSDLSGVNAVLSWSTPNLPPSSLPTTEASLALCLQGLAISGDTALPPRPKGVTPLSAVALSINVESGSLLPLALRGRLCHGRHFTFRSTTGGCAVTLLPDSVTGAFVTPGSPYAVCGQWLQLLVCPSLLQTMCADLCDLADPDQVKVPVTFEWAEHKLRITIEREQP